MRLGDEIAEILQEQSFLFRGAIETVEFSLPHDFQFLADAGEGGSWKVKQLIFLFGDRARKLIAILRPTFGQALVQVREVRICAFPRRAALDSGVYSHRLDPFSIGWCVRIRARLPARSDPTGELGTGGSLVKQQRAPYEGYS